MISDRFTPVVILSYLCPDFRIKQNIYAWTGFLYSQFSVFNPTNSTELFYTIRQVLLIGVHKKLHKKDRFFFSKIVGFENG